MGWGLWVSDILMLSNCPTEQMYRSLFTVQYPINARIDFDTRTTRSINMFTPMPSQLIWELTPHSCKRYSCKSHYCSFSFPFYCWVWLMYHSCRLPQYIYIYKPDCDITLYRQEVLSEYRTPSCGSVSKFSTLFINNDWSPTGKFTPH